MTTCKYLQGIADIFGYVVIFIITEFCKMECSNTKIALARPDYKDSCTKIFSSLIDSTDFSDVTLACDDGTLIHGHKFLLSAASPYLRSKLGTFPFYMQNLNLTKLRASI